MGTVGGRGRSLRACVRAGVPRPDDVRTVRRGDCRLAKGVVYDLGVITLERSGSRACVYKPPIAVYRTRLWGSFNLRLIFRQEQRREPMYLEKARSMQRGTLSPSVSGTNCQTESFIYHHESLI